MEAQMGRGNKESCILHFGIRCRLMVGWVEYRTSDENRTPVFQPLASHFDHCYMDLWNYYLLFKYFGSNIEQAKFYLHWDCMQRSIRRVFRGMD
jgi:hypothetical protein